MINPEQVLVDLDVRQSRERANATNRHAFGTTMLILSAATDVAQVASGHADRSTGATTASIGASLYASEAQQETMTLNIAAQREVWARFWPR